MVTKAKGKKGGAAVAEKKDDKAEVIEGKFVEEKKAKADTRVAIAEPKTPMDVSQWRPEFAKADVDRAIVQVEEKRRFFDNVMKVGAHYAIIPGQKPTPRIDQATGEQVKVNGVLITDAPKPALLKPGAELLNAAMGLHPVLEDEYPPTMEERAGEMFIQFRRVCRIYRQTGPGENDRMLVGQASGECNSWEPKYRYRGSAGRMCPNCGGAFIIKGRAEYAPTVDGKKGSPKKAGFENGGFVCLRSKGGCGENYTDADMRMKQDVVREKNPDPMGLTNTILKMADKRALVAATLIATGCSDLFTQDIEETVSTQAAATAKATGDPADYSAEEDPGAPTHAASDSATSNEGAKQEAPKPVPPKVDPTGNDLPDPEGWAELRLFHRWSIEHSTDPRRALFTKFMDEHGFGTWAALKKAWDTECVVPEHAEFKSTIKQEVRAVISPLGAKVDAPLGTP